MSSARRLHVAARALAALALLAVGAEVRGARPDALIHGEVSPGWEPVREAFARNFTSRRELGAAVAVYHQGEKVVDLWGGVAHAASGRPWEEDTLVPVFSTTKGVAAMVMAHAVSRGLMGYGDRVAEHWPEFAANGKAEITVEQLLGHQAGLAVLDTRLDLDDLRFPARVANALAVQAPAWRPGERHGYHATTLGLYESALLARVDPQRRSLGQYWTEELARPLGLDFHIGLPEDLWPLRVAHVERAGLGRTLLRLPAYPRASRHEILDPRSDLVRALSVPEGWDVNDPGFLAIEQPSSNGVGSARALARAYGLLAARPEDMGVSREVLRRLAEVPPDPAEGPEDAILHVDTWYHLGFSKPGPRPGFGDDEGCFGTPGVGGSRGFADPDDQLGYAYVMNQMGASPEADPRDRALQEAVYRVLRERKPAAR